jgi:hypothetical protein
MVRVGPAGVSAMAGAGIMARGVFGVRPVSLNLAGPSLDSLPAVPSLGSGEAAPVLPLLAPPDVSLPAAQLPASAEAVPAAAASAANTEAAASPRDQSEDGGPAAESLRALFDGDAAKSKEEAVLQDFASKGIPAVTARFEPAGKGTVVPYHFDHVRVSFASPEALSKVLRRLPETSAGLPVYLDLDQQKAAFKQTAEREETARSKDVERLENMRRVVQHLDDMLRRETLTREQAEEIQREIARLSASIRRLEAKIGRKTA